MLPPLTTLLTTRKSQKTSVHLNTHTIIYRKSVRQFNQQVKILFGMVDEREMKRRRVLGEKQLNTNTNTDKILKEKSSNNKVNDLENLNINNFSDNLEYNPEYDSIDNNFIDNIEIDNNFDNIEIDHTIHDLSNLNMNDNENIPLGEIKYPKRKTNKKSPDLYILKVLRDKIRGAVGVERGRDETVGIEQHYDNADNNLHSYNNMDYDNNIDYDNNLHSEINSDNNLHSDNNSYIDSEIDSFLLSTKSYSFNSQISHFPKPQKLQYFLSLLRHIEKGRVVATQERCYGEIVVEVL